MSTFLTFLVSGAVSGALFAMMAAGLVLTFETSGVFNFAHGAVAFSVALLFYQLHTGAGMPLVPAAFLSIVVFAPILGAILNRMMLRQLATAPMYARIVGTIGLLIALPNLALFIVEQVNAHGGDLPTTTEIYTTPGLGPSPPHVFRPMTSLAIDSDQLAILAAAVSTSIVLWFVLRRTRLGLAMRADVDRRELASLRGINTDRITGITWMLSMMIAGLGGVLLSPLFGLRENTYTFVVLGSIAAVVFAGFRSVPWALAGGLLLGVLVNMIAGYGDVVIPSTILELPGFRTSIPFIITLVGIAVLAFRQRNRGPRVAPREIPPHDYRAGLPTWRRRLPWVIVTVIIVVYTLVFASQYWAGLVAQALVFATIFLSFVVVTGLGGMVSLAQAGFVTAGAFMAGWLVSRDLPVSIPFLLEDGHPNFLFAVAAAAIVAGLSGAIVALMVRRLGTLELALATLAIAFVAEEIIFSNDSIRNGSSGYFVNPPEWGPLDFSDDKTLAIGVLIVFGLLTLVVRNLQRSASGRAMLAARSSDVAARTSIVSPDRAKVAVFAVGAAIAGIGGALLSVVSSPFTNTTAPALTGMIWLAVCVVMGIRRPAGALLAGLSYVLLLPFLTTVSGDSGFLDDLASSSYFLPILFGMGAISLARNPDGVLALSNQQRFERSERKRRRAREDTSTDDRPPVRTADGAASPSPAASGAALLGLRGIYAGYGEVEVLHGVDLDLAEGSITALLGSNGAGKSTVCAVISGLLRPSGGEVRWDGEDITGWSPDRRARAGIMLSPEARGVFPGLTVEENLSVWLPKTSDRAVAYDKFPILRERRGQRAGLLSGGEQQMLALASAISRPPRFFIADEPTLGLAPLAAASVCRTLHELRDLGTSILLVEEKAAEIFGLADTIALLQLGRVAWVGPKDELSQDDLAAAYLGRGQPAGT